MGQRPVEPIRDPYLKTYRCMYQRAEQVNRCVQFSFVEMSKEAEVGLLCQNLSFPGSFFVKMEASPCPDLGWFFSSRRRFQAYQADIWMIDTAERPGQRPPVLKDLRGNSQDLHIQDIEKAFILEIQNIVHDVN